MPDRWSTLRAFVDLLYAEPLPTLSVASAFGVSSDPLALREWDWLTDGRYDDLSSARVLDVGVVDPSQRLSPPPPEAQGPAEWLAIATDRSGDACWFVDANDVSEDPAVFYWDDAISERVTQSCDHLSQLLTSIVVEETLSLQPMDRRRGPLGVLAPEVRFARRMDERLSPMEQALRRYEGWPQCGSRVDAHLTGAWFMPWRVHGLDLKGSADGTLLVQNDLLVTLTGEAWGPIEALMAEEAADRVRERRRREAEEAQEFTRTLEAAGVPSATPEGLLASLEALEGSLNRLDSVFLGDFRTRVGSGVPTSGQRWKAARILAKFA